MTQINASGAAVIALAYPIETEGTTLSTITLRRPKVRDMLAAQQAGTTDQEREMHMFANLAEVSPEAIHALDLVDYYKLQQAYQGFLSLPPSKPELSVSS